MRPLALAWRNLFISPKQRTQVMLNLDPFDVQLIEVYGKLLLCWILAPKHHQPS